MHKLLITLLVVVAVLAGAAVSAVMLIDGERLRTAAIDYLEQREGVELEIERVERTIGLSPRIELHGVRLRQRDFADNPLLALDYAAFNIELLSFLFGPATLRDVAVEAPTVVLPVADEGLLYWGPVIADLMERLRRFEWAVHGFHIARLEVEARHTVHDARALLTAAAIDGAMPNVADLTLTLRQLNGDLRAALPLPIEGSVVIDEARLHHTGGDLPVTLEADGSIGSRTLTVRARSTNVLKGDPNGRGPLHAMLSLGASALQVSGTASRGTTPHFDLDLDLAVRELAGIASSNARFRLSDDGLAWNVSDITATFGDAMATGQLRVERRDPRPLLTGAIELAGFAFGANRHSEDPPSRSGLVRSAVERLDRLDAMLDVQVADLTVLDVPIASLRAQARLTDGRLEIEPVEAGVLSGAATGRVELANDADTPRLELMTRFDGVETTELAAALGIDHEIFGELQGSVELTSTASERLLDGAAGNVTLLMSGGQLSQALAQLVDMDFAEQIMRRTFKRKRGETTPIRCAIADFEGENGIFESQALVVDTGEVKIVGAGSINLAERTIDLVIRPYGKNFSLFSSDAPLRVSGSLKKPDVAPQKGDFAMSLLTPIETGRPENADCQALIQWASDAMADSERQSEARRNRR